MKHTSKQLKRIWPKLVLNIQLNKRKLSKQQKAAAIYMTFYSYHYTNMRWMRGYQSRFSVCGPPRSCVRSSWYWCKIINIIWREGRREEGWDVGEGRQKRWEEGKQKQYWIRIIHFRYHRNCYRNFVNKLQINTAKSTYGHTSSDKAPSTIFWRAY